MAKTKPLNVRKHLEHIIWRIDWMLERHDSYHWSIDWMLERHDKYEQRGIYLPPIDVKNLKEIRFFAKAILRKHKSKKTRKDIYVER
jgi:hypothetical protein